MASTEYRESYFESPQDLELKLEDDFLAHVAGHRVGEAYCPHRKSDNESVVAVFGIASLFGFVRVSELMKALEPDIRGRIVVFFPGEYEDNNYRFAGCAGRLELPRRPNYLAGRSRGVRRMKNREVYQRDPDKIILLNNGVAAMTDAETDDERRTLRFELEHFVCEGQYRSGLVRILDAYIGNQGQPEQPAAWISGFFGSGKSHLAKMLRFPVDGLHLSGGRRQCPRSGEAAGRGTGFAQGNFDLWVGGDMDCTPPLEPSAPVPGIASGWPCSVSCSSPRDCPEGFPQARFSLWLKKNGIHEQRPRRR